MRNFRGPLEDRVDIGDSSDDEIEGEEFEEATIGGLLQHFDLADFAFAQDSPTRENDEDIDFVPDEDDSPDDDYEPESLDDSDASNEAIRQTLASNRAGVVGPIFGAIGVTANASARFEIPATGSITVTLTNEAGTADTRRASVQVQTEDTDRRPRRSRRRVRIEALDEDSMESIGLELKRVQESLMPEDSNNGISQPGSSATKFDLKVTNAPEDSGSLVPMQGSSAQQSVNNMTESVKERTSPRAVELPKSESSCMNCVASAPASDDEGSGHAAAETDDDEVYCNPMTTEIDEHSEELLRGDRIGSTTYSERHVLKILMEWMKKLPECAKAYKIEDLEEAEEKEESEADSLPVMDQPLEAELEDSMALLWDMSAEKDVMHFLLENNILILIRDNLDFIHCPSRLKEIALGILANLLSCTSILETFSDKDDALNLVERVIAEALSNTNVPVLIQVYAVLRRIAFYMRNAKPVKRWMSQLLNPDFIRAANFLLASSTNDVDEKFLPITTSEYLPSLCEALRELMKHLRSKDIAAIMMPPSDPRRIPQCDTTETRPLGDEFDIPPLHVQVSLLNGLASMCYLMKFESGKQLLAQNNETVLDVLLPILQKFNVCTERIGSPEKLDYFALAIDLLSQCHMHLPRAFSPAIVIPTYTTLWFLKNEEENVDENDGSSKMHTVTLRNGETVESDISPFLLIYYNYIVDMEEKFGKTEVQMALSEANNKELIRFHKDSIKKALQLQNSLLPKLDE